MTFLRTILRAARERLDSPAGRILLVLSCVLVFSFAFHAKVAIYHNPGHPDGSTASKMWPAGGKLESGVLGPELMVVGLLAVLLLVLCAPAQQRLAAMRRSPILLPRDGFRSERFQRPPPQY
jgi:hypothetical protein